MSGLIIVFSSIGGTTGALVTGSLFQARGAEAFYFLLAPIILLCVVLWVFKKSIDNAPGLGARRYCKQLSTLGDLSGESLEMSRIDASY